MLHCGDAHLKPLDLRSIATVVNATVTHVCGSTRNVNEGHFFSATCSVNFNIMERPRSHVMRLPRANIVDGVDGDASTCDTGWRGSLAYANATRARHHAGVQRQRRHTASRGGAGDVHLPPCAKYSSMAFPSDSRESGGRRPPPVPAPYANTSIAGRRILTPPACARPRSTGGASPAIAAPRKACGRVASTNESRWMRRPLGRVPGAVAAEAATATSVAAAASVDALRIVDMSSCGGAATSSRRSSLTRERKPTDVSTRSLLGSGNPR